MGDGAHGIEEAIEVGAEFDDFAADFHAAGFEAYEVEEVIDEFEEAHAIGLHGGEQVMRFVVVLVFGLDEQIFEGCQQEGERGAEFVADIGEEVAFGLVEFEEFLVVFLEFLLVLVEFVAEGEFAQPEAAEDGIAGDDDDAGEGYEEEVIGDQAEVFLEGLLGVGFGRGGEVWDEGLAGGGDGGRSGVAEVAGAVFDVCGDAEDIDGEDEGGGDDGLAGAPVADGTDGEEDEVESGVVGGSGAFRDIDHVSHEEHGQDGDGDADPLVVFAGEAGEVESPDSTDEQGAEETEPEEFGGEFWVDGEVEQDTCGHEDEDEGAGEFSGADTDVTFVLAVGGEEFGGVDSCVLSCHGLW